jgi:hypothetical protein
MASTGEVGIYGACFAGLEMLFVWRSTVDNMASM